MTPIRLLLTSLVSGLLVLSALGPGSAATVTREYADKPRALITLRLVTTNIDFTSLAKDQRGQLEHVLKAEPDVVVLQEVRELDLENPGGKVDGLDQYRVVQAGTTEKRASAILLRKSRFTIVDQGTALGYSDQPGVDTPSERYLPWAIVSDTATRKRFAVISVHMPIKSKTNASYERAYRQMADNYVALVKQLGRDGRQVLTGGDWNQAVERNDFNIDFDPVDIHQRAGLALNWTYGDACRATRGRSKLDALAWKRGKTTLLDQRCLTRKFSDHRPVLADIRFRA